MMRVTIKEYSAITMNCSLACAPISMSAACLQWQLDPIFRKRYRYFPFDNTRWLVAATPLGPGGIAGDRWCDVP